MVVVMLLFFIMSLVAAYTSRNLIFEQRTSTNQYRSTQALEAADAGVDWALAQLNAGRLTSACVQSTSGTDLSFRERYLTIDAGTGAVSPRSAVLGSGGSVTPQCVLNTGNPSSGNWQWNCHCPLRDTATTALTDPGTAIAPAFILRLLTGPRADLVVLQSNSCTRLDANCLNFLNDRGGTGDGVASVQVTLALRGAINRLPTAPLTVLGNTFSLDSGASLQLRNSDAASSGITVHTAATALPATGLSLTGLPGVAPSGTTVTDDATLSPAGVTGFTAEDRKFVQFFGITPATYQRQPGLPQLDCSGGCNAAAINSLALRNPGRPLWLTGAGGTVTIDATVGTSTAPLLLIVEGDVVLGSGGTLNGLIYGRKANWAWAVTGSPTINGAVIAEGALTISGGSSNMTVTYDAARLRHLRLAQGSFVRVPGSWKDF
ncbi:hypothetical protein IP87_00175 [beta proteobacterium AAP121]|nr:hypothetical protein IP80_20655 [beta proteobacterium AAP65]KPG01147.1 hypothetical protein IP87_00175 [beta proteobacterium AAP121]